MFVPLLAPIADKIRKICENGFNIDVSTWDFLENTLSNPTLNSITSILNDVDDCESNTLIELIFYPVESMQMDLEPLIESTEVTQQDTENLITWLIEAPPIVPLFFRAINANATITMPELAIQRFIERLNLTYRFSPILLNNVEQNLPEKTGNVIKVRLRNANIILEDHQTEFMVRVLTALDYTAPDYYPCLDFVLSILPEINPQTPIYEFLTDKKKFYFQCVERAEHFLEKLRHSNMETLMLQGERAAFIHPQDGRDYMKWIDQICRAVFGYSESFQPPGSEEINIESLDSHHNLSKLIDFLS